MTWTIRKNIERYFPDFDRKMPNLITCEGTQEQAAELAERLTNWNAGCDYAYYVVGVDDEDR